MYSCAPVVVLCGFRCGLIHHPVHTYYFVFALLYMLTVIQTKKGFYLLILSRFIYSFIYFPSSMKIVSKESIMLYVFSRNAQTGREFVSEVECQQFLSPFKVFCNQSAPVPLWDSHSLHHTNWWNKNSTPSDPGARGSTALKTPISHALQAKLYTFSDPSTGHFFTSKQYMIRFWEIKCISLSMANINTSFPICHSLQ